jgi:hypothetical protein
VIGTAYVLHKFLDNMTTYAETGYAGSIRESEPDSKSPTLTAKSDSGSESLPANGGPEHTREENRRLHREDEEAHSVEVIPVKSTGQNKDDGQIPVSQHQANQPRWPASFLQRSNEAIPPSSSTSSSSPLIQPRSQNKSSTGTTSSTPSAESGEELIHLRSGLGETSSSFKPPLPTLRPTRPEAGLDVLAQPRNNRRTREAVNGINLARTKRPGGDTEGNEVDVARRALISQVYIDGVHFMRTPKAHLRGVDKITINKDVKGQEVSAQTQRAWIKDFTMKGGDADALFGTEYGSWVSSAINEALISKEMD